VWYPQYKCLPKQRMASYALVSFPNGSQLLSSARFFLLCEDFEWGHSENLGPVLGSSQALIPRTAPFLVLSSSLTHVLHDR
jgi:hypothetical protein